MSTGPPRRPGGCRTARCRARGTPSPTPSTPRRWSSSSPRARPPAATREAQYDGARRAWREGFVAEAVDAFCRQPFRDSSGSDHAGVMTGADLAGWRASYEPAVVQRFRDVEVAKTDLWGQGPVLLQALAMLDGLPDEALDTSTADGVHTVTEVLKLALADREAWFGDASPVTAAQLLDPAYVADAACPGGRPGLGRAAAGVARRPPAGAGRAHARHVGAPEEAGLGEPTVSWDGQTRGDTCHIDVADRWGNIISATPSGGWLQSSPTVPELGFCLGSRLQMFWLDEGLPATLAPGRRPRTTLSPTLVLRDGRPVLATGTPGGDQQEQWQLPFLLRHVVGRPRPAGGDRRAVVPHHVGAELVLPARDEPGRAGRRGPARLRVLADLEARGHGLVRAGGWTLGRLCAVARDAGTGALSAAADPRGAQCYAVGTLLGVLVEGRGLRRRGRARPRPARRHRGRGPRAPRPGARAPPTSAWPASPRRAGRPSGRSGTWRWRTASASGCGTSRPRPGAARC